MAILIVWLLGAYCGALLTWIVMDAQRDREWYREHGIERLDAKAPSDAHITLPQHTNADIVAPSDEAAPEDHLTDEERAGLMAMQVRAMAALEDEAERDDGKEPSTPDEWAQWGEWKDDGNAEPLLTGEFVGVWARAGMDRHVRIVIPEVDDRAAALDQQRVAVYPADATPAPRAVTADDISDLVAKHSNGWLTADEAEDIARRLNERIGARPLPTREQVREAIYDHMGDPELDTDATADAVMALFAQPTREGE